MPAGLERRGARVGHDPDRASEPGPRHPARRAGALRAACEEMGAVLIRASHSANIKERRDASCALFDPDGELVMQAEHIPVHLGAMPAAVAAVAKHEHEPGVSWVLNDPYSGGTHLPGHHRRHARLRRRRADRLRRQPRPPRRRRRPDAGLDARRLQDARRRGRRDRAAAARRGRDRAARRARCASRRSAAPTCAPSSPPTAPASRACEELHDRMPLAEAMEATIDYAERRTRAAIEELEDGERTAEDVLEARTSDLHAPTQGHRRRRRAAPGLHRHPPTSTRATSTARWR